MFRHEKITSFEEVRLRLSGMRITEVCEIIRRGDEAEVSRYFLSYENGEDKYNLEQRVSVSAEKALALLNECGVLKWDGFYGKNPPGLLDGTMFDFNATLNSGKKIHASGSNNYPKHFRDFTDAINQWLEG